MKLPSKSASNLIKKNIQVLTPDQQNNINQSNTEIDPLSLISVDIKKILNTNKDKTFSVRLIKYVEPYTIDNIDYSLFYTEVDHNLKINDKVFVVGGNYDSETIISNKKYSKFSTGYKVLYVDRCKIVLNILYTGILPTNEEPLDNFTKIYTATNEYEWNYYLNTFPHYFQKTGI